MKIWCSSLGILGISCGFVDLVAPKNQPPQDSNSKAVTIIITGDFKGNLAPCGCTSPMIGGIQRLGTLVKRLRTQSDVVLLVNGGTVKNISTLGSIEAKQSLLKAQAMAEAAKVMDASAYSIGDREASYGPSLISQMQFLSGNRLIQGAVINDQAIPNFKVRGDLIVGTAEANGSELAGALSRPDESPDQATTDDIVNRLVMAATSTLKLPILLFRGSESEARELAIKFPSLRLIVYSLSGSAPVKPDLAGETLLVSPGDLGREVVELKVAGSELSDYRVAKLTPDLNQNNPVSKVYANYLRGVGLSGLLSEWPRIQTGKYIGSQACASCHLTSYHKWIQTAHYHAYHDIKAQGHGQDPDCVKCHVTGLSSKYGFVSEFKNSQLARVSCESCHGPGEAHYLHPLVARLSSGNKSCISCHTIDNSPNFDFQEYWAKIKHH